ncbi:hypothetical protein KFZ58_07665 [Virgibacillus sp. NKC19-16]|uniref:hypothetical protein n=1 Tax=Virgibacillus salidurans TaxID=2831673 RepID=UPI001F2076C2|nr:hypothetical protein [Virgibacillus sp. NKC19-16]UJL47723.1 hypothetical protein KFZ58_07665 [Virgibacillus sp. NKC19-16]
MPDEGEYSQASQFQKLDWISIFDILFVWLLRRKEDGDASAIRSGAVNEDDM